MSGMQGLDPDRLRSFGGVAESFADTAEAVSGRAATLISICELDSGVTDLCDEIGEESRLLAGLARAKADQMELAGSGLHFYDTIVDGFFDRLERSLTDGVGATGLVGDNAVATLAAGFGLVNTDGNDALSIEELRAAADDASLPVELRIAAAYLVDNPVLAEHAAMTSIIENSFGETGLDFRSGEITAAGLEALTRQNEVLRTLSDRDVFAELESAKNGEFDGDLSSADLEAILASTDASPEARQVAAYLLGDEAAWFWFRRGADAGFEAEGWYAFDSGGTMSFDNVLALTVNQHAFAADPAGANEFVLSLSGPLRHTTDTQFTETTRIT